jgi:hypothetical protein
MRVSTLAASLIAAGLSCATPASVTRQMGFEEAAFVADTIVIGIVTENPEVAVLQGGRPFRRQRVLVSVYFKGGGPSEIVVLSPGGRYSAEIPGVGRREIEAIDGNDCRLPGVGTEALLFLRKRGDDFLVASATHGVVPVRTDRATGCKSVHVLFDDFENLGTDGRNAAVNRQLQQRLAASRAGDVAQGRVPESTREKFVDTVSVEDLARTIKNLKRFAPPKGGRR